MGLLKRVTIFHCVCMVCTYFAFLLICLMPMYLKIIAGNHVNVALCIVVIFISAKMSRHCLKKVLSFQTDTYEIILSGVLFYPILFYFVNKITVPIIHNQIPWQFMFVPDVDMVILTAIVWILLSIKIICDKSGLMLRRVS